MYPPRCHRNRELLSTKVICLPKCSTKQLPPHILRASIRSLALSLQPHDLGADLINPPRQPTADPAGTLMHQPCWAPESGVTGESPSRGTCEGRCPQSGHSRGPGGYRQGKRCRHARLRVFWGLTGEELEGEINFGNSHRRTGVNPREVPKG